MDHTKTEHQNALVAKALGGCGIHNAMLYVRGLESDFSKWDVEGFDYASAVEAWKTNENYTGPGPLPEWHGRGGPITTSPPAFIDEVCSGVQRMPAGRRDLQKNSPKIVRRGGGAQSSTKGREARRENGPSQRTGGKAFL